MCTCIMILWINAEELTHWPLLECCVVGHIARAISKLPLVKSWLQASDMPERRATKVTDAKVQAVMQASWERPISPTGLIWQSFSFPEQLKYADQTHIYTVMTFKYVEGGPDREAPEVV